MSGILLPIVINGNESAIEFAAYPGELLWVTHYEDESGDASTREKTLDMEHLAGSPELLPELFLCFGADETINGQQYSFTVKNPLNGRLLTIDSNIDNSEYEIDVYSEGQAQDEGVHWTHTEIQEDPSLVVGAILGAFVSDNAPSVPSEPSPSVCFTDEDDKVAQEEGWGFFETSDGTIEINKLDELDTLASDTEAYQLILNKAKNGSPLHRKALLLMKRNNPNDLKLFSQVVPSLDAFVKTL